MEITKTLTEITTIVGENAVRPDLGLRLTKKLSDIERRLQCIIVELVALEDYVKLKSTQPAENPVLSAAQLAELPFQDLIDKSALMAGLYRSGVNIHRHTVFTDIETKIAASIAENYSDFSAILRSYRKAYVNKSGILTMSFCGGPAVYDFVNLLQSNGVINVKKTLLQKEDHWAPHKFEYLKNATAKQNLRVIYKIQNAKLSDFLKGDWMTAFTGQIILDHFNRNQIVHETFSKVAYQAPVDIISTRSDFDVITKFDNRVLCFECKSGVIRDAEIDDIIKKSTDIKKVLTQFLSHELVFKFLLIFDSELNDKETTVAHFAKHGIAALEIRDVRKLIFDIMAMKEAAPKSVLVLA